nr:MULTISPECIES: DUF4123 domain-containing protein [unclassified Modicisalibacter]
MGLLSEDARTALWQAFQGHPWFQQAAFSALRPLGPWLFVADIETLLDDLYPLAEGGFHGLLMTHQPAADEAEKLGAFCVVEDAAGEEQLLRYYAPHVLPVVHRFTDKPWYHGLFGSLSHWWLPGLDGWLDYAGTWSPTSDSPDAGADARILLTPDLLQALGGDPTVHRILGELERSSPSLFQVDCPGIRLAIVDQAIHQARQAGLESLQDLSVYTAYCVAHGMAVTRRPDFLRAVDQSRSLARPLAETLQATGVTGNNETDHE